MKPLREKITIQINANVYIKDPNSSELGRKIIRLGIDLMDVLGFENFNFKKLSKTIGSTEASIYRYFENKHNFLAYITLWYWGWLEYRLVLRTLNIDSPVVRLRKAIELLTEEVVEDSDFTQVNEVKLNKVVISESSKIYFSKQVASDNEVGVFKVYKDVVQRVADIILEIKPDFLYPHMMVSTLIEGAHHQRYFAQHLPRLTDVVKGEDAVVKFYTEWVQRELGIEED